MEYYIKIKKEKKNLFNDPWVWRMAIKDARNNVGRLFLFISSVIIGIAALVSINSFNINLMRSIDDQAKELLGADFVVTGNKSFEQELVSAFDSVKAEKASEADLASMVSFMTDMPGTRLVRIIAIEGDFPFYGDLVTLPENAVELMKKGPVVFIRLDNTKFSSSIYPNSV